MGTYCCAYRRSLDSDEETFIIPSEYTLGYYKSSSEEIEITFKKYKRANALTLAQFREAAALLKLNITEISNEYSMIGNFYKEFVMPCVEYGEGYDLNKLIVLGVLLGKASTRDKVTKLFEQFDD
jgi:hypothetical protein